MGKKLYQITTQAVDLSLCDPHPENYNKHDDIQIQKLRGSLREFGQVETPVVQAREDGRFLIVAGHGVIAAAQLEQFDALEMRVIPETWTAEKVKAYLVASNELARKSERDDFQFLSILKELEAADESLLEATGVDDDEFEALLKQFGEGGDGVTMKELPVQKPPKYVWVLIGVPLVEYGRIAGPIEMVAADPAVIVETTVSDK
ncbi:MAG: ParB N-terminal domain-containing protein [Chloroflexi bacterium]|nr:ParB N-terminal domain-containing protein [Chloroflexota bacterium]